MGVLRSSSYFQLSRGSAESKSHLGWARTVVPMEVSVKERDYESVRCKEHGQCMIKRGYSLLSVRSFQSEHEVLWHARICSLCFFFVFVVFFYSIVNSVAIFIKVELLFFILNSSGFVSGLGLCGETATITVQRFNVVAFY